MPEQTLKELSDQELHDELQRRADLLPPITPSAELISLSELPAGAWTNHDLASAKEGQGSESLAASLNATAELAVTRLREILSIPIDPNAENAAVLRSVNAAAGTIMSLIAKLNEQSLRLPKRNYLPELLARIEEEEKRQWNLNYPELVRQLGNLSEAQVKEVLQGRRKLLADRGDHRLPIQEQTRPGGIASQGS